MENRPLLPELISKDDDAYSVVEDLNEALNVAFKQKKIRNIALTGPYGSGKSSILETLITTLPEERKPLHISLATLRVDDAAEELDKSSHSSKERDEESDKSSRSSKEREEESDKSSRSSKEREEESDKSSRSSKEKEDAEEALNRKIEYSILQQLIYHEEVNIVPNSRFRRILHISSEKLKQYSFGVIGFILAFFIAFEPSWARIESLYYLSSG